MAPLRQGDGEIFEDLSYSRVAAELVAAMSSNRRTPLLDIEVTVKAVDLQAVLGAVSGITKETAETCAQIVERDFELPLEARRALANVIRDHHAVTPAPLCEVCSTPEDCRGGRVPCDLSGEFHQRVDPEVANKLLARIRELLDGGEKKGEET